ncbi:hypothetical protein [Paraburkholderia caribensis]|uniref:hypothetical protein n=1 Tax=Paraburkholderia caribensis TaxID=75105 RepID=UPI001CAB1503|nr:hypothetical protein [Paraburkholderia caribensis]CAG9269793.1 hypothetical protein PCAR4_830133 [Paraburkholderia caribensis]
MNRQGRVDNKVKELLDEFEARLRALGFITAHVPAANGKEGLLSYQEVIREDRSCATSEETGTITEWFDRSRPPNQDGQYQVRRGSDVTFAEFKAGDWEGAKPDAWRGIDWRISNEDSERFLSILSDQKHGSKPDAALALIRHHVTTRANDRQASEVKDGFGITEKVYSGVILKKDPEGARQILHLVDKDVLSEVPEHVRQAVEHRITTFALSQD